VSDTLSHPTAYVQYSDTRGDIIPDYDQDRQSKVRSTRVPFASTHYTALLSRDVTMSPAMMLIAGADTSSASTPDRRHGPPRQP
jgi:hypothetical protein